MGAACSSEETSHKSPVQESVTPVTSQSIQSVNRKGVMPPKIKSRTVSIINTEAYDLLKVRHPELKATLAEFDKVTKTLEAKKGNLSTEDDYRNIYKLLDEKVDDKFMEYAEQEQRLLMGNYLAKNGFIPVLVEIYKQVFHDHDLDAFEDDVADEDEDATYFLLLKLIRTILWNFGDGSADFGLGIVNETDMLTYLLEDLFAVEDDMKYFENINNTNHFPFNSTLGIINNCARSGINRNVYKMKRLKKDEEVHMVDILESILKTDIKYVKLVTLLALSYIVNEQQNKKLSADESIFVFLLDIIKKAEKAKDHRQFGFSIQELVNGLANLARNDENKTRIMDKDAYPILKSILKKGDEAEQCAVVRALWELSFIKKNRDKFKKDNELWWKLQSLRESDNESLAKAAQGACFVIDQDSAANAKRVQEVSSAVSKDAGHIMLSYNWGDQKTLLKIRDRLIKCGMTIWMDVDNMEGSILEAMATAVEDASVILICYSEKYKDSQNCRTEAEYAYKLKKDIVPLLMQQSYSASGWLGAIIGAKLFYDFSGKYDFDKKFGELQTILSGKLVVKKQQETKLPAITEVPHGEKAPSSETVVVLSWTRKDIDNWLKQNKLQAFSGLKNLTGEQLAFLYKLFRRAPEFFYKCIEDKLGMKSLEDLMRFSDAVERLNQEYPDINKLLIY